MGRHRKIPKSRRNKKIKFVDPFYKGPSRKTKKRQLLPNEPPQNDDYQEAPGSEKLFSMKNGVKKRKKNRKKYKDDFIIVENEKEEHQPGMTKPLKPIPRMVKQRPYENMHSFLNRLQEMVEAAKAEAKVEQKYGIEVVNVDKSGNAQYVKPHEESKKFNKRKLNLDEKRDVEDVRKKRMKINEKCFDLQKEHVHFGEVAIAPPVFTAKPRKASQTEKAGKKDLQLKKMLHYEDKASQNVTIMWKAMAPQKREVMEEERLRAVEMYRLLKKKKQK